MMPRPSLLLGRTHQRRGALGGIHPFPATGPSVPASEGTRGEHPSLGAIGFLTLRRDGGGRRAVRPGGSAGPVTVGGERGQRRRGIFTVSCVGVVNTERMQYDEVC